MHEKDQILETIRDLKAELERRYEVKAIGLFGFVFRGDHGPASDVDVLVEFRKPIDFFTFLELEEFLAERLGAKVDLVSKKALKQDIGRAILSEVVMA